METVVGIDLGTQSLKLVFYKPASREIVASSSAAIALDQDSQGKAEQEASWWLQALAECFAEIPEDIKKTAKAMAVSGLQHGFVALDKNGDVLSPVKLWCDTTTVAECEELMAAVGGEAACFNLLGNKILPGYTASKILWFKKNKPELYKQLETILLPHDYLNFHLSGDYSMEYGDASGTGLLNIYKREWSREILSAIDSSRDLSACLPELKAPQLSTSKIKEPKFNTPCCLSPERANEYGLPAGIPIATGGGDNMMAAIGTGNVDQGVVTISLGSSGTVYSHCRAPIADEEGRLAAFCSSTGGWLPLLCTMNCTLSTELIRSLFNVELDALESAVVASPIGAGGVLTLPFFNGERNPNLPNAKGTILGLDASNYSKENLIRSAMEGASFGLRLGIVALQEKGVVVNEIRVTGGGSQSACWRQMIADICDVVVLQVKPDEGAAFGAALQALHVFEKQKGKSTDISSIVAEHVLINEQERCEPIEENVDRYREIYQSYKSAVRAVTPFYT